jgi:hypothetical protein
LGFKDIGIRKSEFVANNQLLSKKYKKINDLITIKFIFGIISQSDNILSIAK